MKPKDQIVFQVARDRDKNYALAVNGVVLGGKPLGYLDGRVIGTYTVTAEELERALGVKLVPQENNASIRIDPARKTIPLIR